MKNIQVIDGALNCSYDVFAVSDRDFASMFAPGTDVAFNDEVARRLRGRDGRKVYQRLWRRPVEKTRLVGLHGTLFWGLPHKKDYYPTRREAEMVVLLGGRAFPQGNALARRKRKARWR